MLKIQTGRFKSFLQSVTGTKKIDTVSFLDNLTPESEQAGLTILGNAVWADGNENSEAVEKLAKMLSSRLPASDINSLIEMSRNLSAAQIAATADKLKNNSVETHIQLLTAVMVINLSSESEGFSELKQQYFRKLAEKFDIPAENVAGIEKNVLERSHKKQRLIKSGAGIIAALFVLLLFILAATWLQSLLFGLVLAYIFLPLEKWYEKLLDKGGALYFISRFMENIGSSFNKITTKPELSEVELKNKERGKLTARATTATLMTVAFLGFVILIILTTVSVKYVSGGLKSAYSRSRNYVQNHEVTVQSELTNGEVKDIPVISNTDATEKKLKINAPISIPENVPFHDDIQYWLEKLEAQKPHFENLPLIRGAIDYLSHALQNENIRRDMLNMIFKKTGGVISVTTGIISWIVVFLLNLLLTFFFFSLILRKMADGVNNTGNTAEQQSGYIVKSIIYSEWMPEVHEDSIQDAQRIITEVINKLKAWARGYITLVMIDSTVYTTSFVLIGVPYAVVLGIIAGMGVLLPYIGPIASASLTILVCLAAGDASMLQIVAVACVYLIYNGIIEQFFLYPSVIGDRLGLTTLETIIVVLLGALFGGIPGMIFSLPATSVMKYLIQQIYGWWRSNPYS